MPGPRAIGMAVVAVHRKNGGYIPQQVIGVIEETEETDKVHWACRRPLAPPIPHSVAKHAPRLPLPMLIIQVWAHRTSALPVCSA